MEFLRENGVLLLCLIVLFIGEYSYRLGIVIVLGLILLLSLIIYKNLLLECSARHNLICNLLGVIITFLSIGVSLFLISKG